MLNIVIHRKPLVKHHEPLVKHHETLLKQCETSWNTRTLIIRCDDIGARCGDVGTWRGDVGNRAEVIRYDDMRSMRRHRRSRGVTGNIGVGITPEMCNRVANHGDMGTFSRPGLHHCSTLCPEWLHRQCVGLAFRRSHVCISVSLSAVSLVICSPHWTV